MKILKFSAKWCGSCNTLQGVINTWSDEVKSKIVSVDAEKDFELSRKYGVRGLPTIIVTDDEGKEVIRFGMNVTEESLKQYV